MMPRIIEAIAVNTTRSIAKSIESGSKASESLNSK